MASTVKTLLVPSWMSTSTSVTDQNSQDDFMKIEANHFSPHGFQIPQDGGELQDNELSAISSNSNTRGMHPVIYSSSIQVDSPSISVDTQLQTSATSWRNRDSLSVPRNQRHALSSEQLYNSDSRPGDRVVNSRQSFGIYTRNSRPSKPATYTPKLGSIDWKSPDRVTNLPFRKYVSPRTGMLVEAEVHNEGHPDSAKASMYNAQLHESKPDVEEVDNRTESDVIEGDADEGKNKTVVFLYIMREYYDSV